MPAKRVFEFSSAPELVQAALGLDYFKAPAAIPAFWKPGGETHLTVVTGENASGKSFFRRVLASVCQQASADTEFMGISMEGRRNIVHMPHLCLVYGDEHHEATGVNSTETVLIGIRTSQSRKNRHVIFWDEPDLGLSDSWAAGLGVKLAAFAKESSPHLLGSFIVTHNKALVRQLLPVDPHYLHLGVDPREAPQSLQAWYDQVPQPRDIEKLPKASRERYKRIQQILDRVRA